MAAMPSRLCVRSSVAGPDLNDKTGSGEVKTRNNGSSVCRVELLEGQRSREKSLCVQHNTRARTHTQTQADTHMQTHTNTHLHTHTHTCTHTHTQTHKHTYMNTHSHFDDDVTLTFLLVREAATADLAVCEVNFLASGA